jgi:hypothetical protein
MGEPGRSRTKYNRFAGVERCAQGMGSPDTLLGPEGTGTSPQTEPDDRPARSGHLDVGTTRTQRAGHEAQVVPARMLRTA